MCLFGIFEVKKYKLPTYRTYLSMSPSKIQIIKNNIHRMTSFTDIAIHTLLMSRFIIHVQGTSFKKIKMSGLTINHTII